MHRFRIRRRRRGGGPRTGTSYANVAATLALFLAAGGGTAWAVAHHYLITSTSQIKPSVLRKLHGANGKNGINGANGGNGAKGVTGPTGPTGANGTNATINGVAAGGSLSGSYPNPTLASGSVTDSTIAAGTTSVAEAGGTVSVSGTTPTLQNSFDRLGGTVAVTRMALGEYDIAIPGVNVFFSHEITQITPLDTGPGFIARISSVSGHLIVSMYNTSGTLVDSGFSFVLYD